MSRAKAATIKDMGYFNDKPSATDEEKIGLPLTYKQTL